MGDAKLFQCKWSTCTATFISHEDFITHFREAHEKRLLEIRELGINYIKGTEEYVWHCHWKGSYSLLPSNGHEEMCMKSFNRLDNFKAHIRSHTGDKPYICTKPGCNKGFASASDRLKHEKRTHSTEKPYRCEYGNCLKSYTDPSSLRKHCIKYHAYELYESSRQSRQLLPEETQLRNRQPPPNIIYVWTEQLPDYLEKPENYLP